MANICDSGFQDFRLSSLISAKQKRVSSFLIANTLQEIVFRAFEIRRFYFRCSSGVNSQTVDADTYYSLQSVPVLRFKIK